jgi:hypothetical protein
LLGLLCRARVDAESKYVGLVRPYPYAVQNWAGADTLGKLLDSRLLTEEVPKRTYRLRTISAGK